MALFISRMYQCQERIIILSEVMRMIIVYWHVFVENKAYIEQNKDRLGLRTSASFRKWKFTRNRVDFYTQRHLERTATVFKS